MVRSQHTLVYVKLKCEIEVNYIVKSCASRIDPTFLVVMQTTAVHCIRLCNIISSCVFPLRRGMV